MLDAPSEREALRKTLVASAEPAKAEPMAGYMKDQFHFLGIAAKDRRAASEPWTTAARSASADELIGFAAWCWEQPEREFQYVAFDALRAGVAQLRADDLDSVRGLIEVKPWWDTVDALASWVVGPIVQNHDLGSTMDQWIDDTDIWVARTAILHQLGYKEETDAERLFEYVQRRAADKEFFIRKALGWALRHYARTDPVGVLAFVETHEDELSGLTVREALKHLR